MSGAQDLREDNERAFQKARAEKTVKRELADAHDEIRALTVQLSDSEKSEQSTENSLYVAQDEILKLLKAAVAGMLKVGFAPNEVVSAVGTVLRGKRE